MQTEHAALVAEIDRIIGAHLAKELTEREFESLLTAFEPKVMRWRAKRENNIQGGTNGKCKRQS